MSTTSVKYMIEVKCKICDNKYFTYPSESNKKITCSKKCHSELKRKKMIGNKIMVGIKRTKETRKKISESHKGKKHWAFGKTFCKEYRERLSKAHIGYKHTEEQKRKIGLKAKGNKYRLGQKNSEESNIKRSKALKGKYTGKLASGWRGGKSFELYGTGFNEKLKEKIRGRDNYKCRECEYTENRLGYKLSVHHIDYDKKNNKKNNLISLCRQCHSKTNFNRNDWINYFKRSVDVNAIS